MLIVLSFLLQACKAEKAPSETTNKTEEDTDKNVVEDEIILDYSSEDDTKEISPSETNGETNKDTVTSDKESTTDLSPEIVPEQSENDKTTEEGSDTETTEPVNPYDKDGDGYVDGWY